MPQTSCTQEESEHCFWLSVCFKSSFISTYTLFYLSLLSLFIISLCLCEEMMDEEIHTGTGMNTDWLHFNYLCSTFSREAKSSVSDKSGRTYLSNWLLIFSSGLHMMHVLATEKLLNSHLGLTRGITKSKTAELCVFVYAWHLAATVSCNCFKAKRNKCSTCNFRIWIQQRQSWFCACKYMQMNSLSEIHIHAQAIKCTSSI